MKKLLINSKCELFNYEQLDNFDYILNNMLNSDMIEIIEELLINGADPNIKNMTLKDYENIDIFKLQYSDEVIKQSGNYTLINQIKKGNINMVKLLLKYKADPNKKVKLKNSALKTAIHINSYEICELLIKYNANVNEIKYNGRSLLMISIFGKMDMCNIIELLLKNKADPNIKDIKYEDTALILASYFGKDNIFKLLLKYGSEPNIKNRYNLNSLDYCVKLREKVIIKYKTDVNLIETEYLIENNNDKINIKKEDLEKIHLKEEYLKNLNKIDNIIYYIFEYNKDNYELYINNYLTKELNKTKNKYEKVIEFYFKDDNYDIIREYSYDVYEKYNGTCKCHYHNSINEKYNKKYNEKMDEIQCILLTELNNFNLNGNLFITMLNYCMKLNIKILLAHFDLKKSKISTLINMILQSNNVELIEYREIIKSVILYYKTIKNTYFDNLINNIKVKDIVNMIIKYDHDDLDYYLNLF
jgi:ankyrin repeat protein